MKTVEYTTETLIIFAVSRIPEEELAGKLTQWQWDDFRVIRTVSLQALRVLVEHKGDSGIQREYDNIDPSIKRYYVEGLATLYSYKQAGHMLEIDLKNPHGF